MPHEASPVAPPQGWEAGTPAPSEKTPAASLGLTVGLCQLRSGAWCLVCERPGVHSALECLGPDAGAQGLLSDRRGESGSQAVWFPSAV